MPELPDITLYIEALRQRILGRRLERSRVRSPFLLRSVDNGLSFALLPIASGGRVYTVAEGAPGSLLVGGPHGIRQLEPPQ